MISIVIDGRFHLGGGGGEGRVKGRGEESTVNGEYIVAVVRCLLVKGRLGERGYEGLKQNNSCFWICTVLSVHVHVGANNLDKTS